MSDCFRGEQTVTKFSPYRSTISEFNNKQSGFIITKYNRGYKHTPEVGNFSNYNAILKKNKDALLER